MRNKALREFYHNSTLHCWRTMGRIKVNLCPDNKFWTKNPNIEVSKIENSHIKVKYEKKKKKNKLWDEAANWNLD